MYTYTAYAFVNQSCDKCILYAHETVTNNSKEPKSIIAENSYIL